MLLNIASDQAVEMERSPGPLVDSMGAARVLHKIREIEARHAFIRTAGAH